MRRTLTLAWRNIWRNRRRTVITMSAIGIGLFLSIFYGGLVAGVISDAKNQLDNGGMGHVEIFPTNYRPRRTASVTMPSFESFEGRLQLPPKSEASGRVLARGLASSAHGSEPVEVFGVDFEREKATSAHLRDVRQGVLPAADDARGLVVGEQLALRLRLKVGSKLRVMVQRADGEMGAELFKVRGIFHSVAPSIGKRQILASTHAVRELVGVGAVSHQVVIQLEHPEDADALAARLQGELGEGFEVKSWGELLPLLRRMEGLIDAVIAGISLFVYLLVGLGILNTLVMSVLERTREFGVLMAVGTRPSQVVALVFAESFWIATVAVVVGGALGIAVCQYFSVNPLSIYSASGESIQLEGVNLLTAFKTRFVWRDVLLAAGFVYLVTLVVAIFPALRVARLVPATALRHV